MRFFAVIFVTAVGFLLLLIFISSQPTNKISPLGQDNHWKSIFTDEFQGHTLDRKKWATCYPNTNIRNGCDHNNGEMELYQPDNVIVNNGVLTLRAERQIVLASNGKIYHYTSGMISTGPSTATSHDIHFSFTYGYVEIRAKMPQGKGFWPAFWLLPTDLSWPPEIDVVEVLGNDVHTINMHYHYLDAQHHLVDNGVSWTGPDFSNGWHTYAVDWEPGSITWYIDGVKRRSFTEAAFIPTKPMYLIANLAVGGYWPGAPNLSTTFPNSFEISYIRVWKQETTFFSLPQPLSSYPVFFFSLSAFSTILPSHRYKIRSPRSLIRFTSSPACSSSYWSVHCTIHFPDLSKFPMRL